MLYPMNVNIEGVACVIIGGGSVASRKAAGLVECGARVTVIAPEVADRVEHMEKDGKVTVRRERYRKGLLKELMPRIVFLASVSSVNRMAAEEAREIGAFINDAAVDDAEAAGQFVVPSRVRRGPLLLTVSTSGANPAFSRFLRGELEREFPSAFADWMVRLHEMRGDARLLMEPVKRQAFWRHAFSDTVLAYVRAGELEKAEAEVRDAISSFGAES